MPSNRSSVNAGASGCSPFGELAGCPGVVLGDLPDEEPEERDDGRDGDPLSDELEPPGHAATMNTAVPTSTFVNSHSTCGISIRMQPCEAE